MVDTALVLAKWLLGFLVFWKVPKTRGRPPSGGHVSPGSAASIVVPARNEEKNLPGLLRSLASQSLRPLEIIVVDDDSSDRTAEVARHWGAAVIRPGRPPPGWTGKTWACWRGARAATGQLLLFLDADTRLVQDGLARMTDEFALQRGGLLSWYPYHTMEKAYERPSAFFNLISMMTLGIATVMGSRISPLGAYGACILCRREDYFLSGGHRTVRGESMEDVVLGRLFRRKAFPMNCLAGEGTVTFRMYPEGISQMIEGWGKNFASGAKVSRASLLLLVVLWVTGALQAAFAVALLPTAFDVDHLAAAIVPYAVYAAQIHWMLRRLGNYGVISSLLFPLPLLFFVGVFFYSLLVTFFARKVRWRGRWIALQKTPGRI